MSEEPRAHCWHRSPDPDAAAYMTHAVYRFPHTDWDEHCCHCGRQRGMDLRPVPVPGHGPHGGPYLVNQPYQKWGTDAPCEPVPDEEVSHE